MEKHSKALRALRAMREEAVRRQEERQEKLRELREMEEGLISFSEVVGQSLLMALATRDFPEVFRLAKIVKEAREYPSVDYRFSMGAAPIQGDQRIKAAFSEIVLKYQAANLKEMLLEAIAMRALGRVLSRRPIHPYL